MIIVIKNFVYYFLISTPFETVELSNIGSNLVILYFSRGEGFMKKGKSRLFFNTNLKYGTIAVVGIGKEELDDKENGDGIDAKKENIRIATASNAMILIIC